MHITIDRAKPTDAQLILDYLKQVGGETDNLTFGAEGMPFSAQEEAAYIAQFENSKDSIMLVAKDGDKIVGIGTLERLPRRMNHRGDLGLSVAKSHWNKGIGSELMEKLLGFARENGFEIVDLQVRSDNISAIHIYHKFGFQKLGTHPAFHKVKDNDVGFDYMYRKL